MTLPRPPIDPTNPIPNQPFESPEVYYLETNQGHLPLGEGLYIREDGTFSNSPYIYCTPQYSNLPVTQPPYGCNTEVNTAGVTDFSAAWRECSSISNFPCLDLSSGTNFQYAWFLCSGLTMFPCVNVSKGTNFLIAWGYTNITSFPLLDLGSGTEFGSAWEGCQNLSLFPKVDVSKGQNFASAWEDCSSLVSFPELNFVSGTNFEYTWRGCASLTTFPARLFDNCSAINFGSAWTNCALSQQSVDNILTSLDTAGQSGGVVNLDGGTSSAPGAAGLTAKANLEAKGWTVLTN